MNQDFEKKVRQKGDEFSLTPRDAVWQRIEASLDENKKRRFAGWWWTLPLLLLIGAGTAYVFYPKNADINNNDGGQVHTKKVNGNQNETDIAVTQNENDPVFNNNNTNSESGSESTGPTVKNEKEKTAVIHPVQKTYKPDGTFRKKPAETEIPGSTNQQSDVAILQTKPVAPAATDITSDNAINKSSAGRENALAGSKSTEEKLITTLLPGTKTASDVTPENGHKQSSQSEDIIEKMDGLVENTGTVGSQTITDGDSITNAETHSASGLQPKTTNSKITWKVVGGIGMSKMQENNFINLFDEEKAFADPLQSGSPVSGIPPVPLKNDKAGAAFSLAIQRSQPLGKRWQWRNSLGWNFQQVTQYRGTRVDSALRFSNANSNTSFSAEYYYKPGNNSSKGTNHRISLSSDFNWNVFPKQSWLWLYAGIYTGYNISNNYLVADQTSRVIKGNGLYSKWFLGLSPGIEFQFKNNWAAGVKGRFDITKAYTALTGKNQYWRGFELNIAIPVRVK